MHLLQDGNSVWGHCPQCGFSGDGLSMLQARYHTRNVEDTLKHLASSGVLSRTEIPEKLILKRERDQEIYGGLSDFLEKAQENVKNMHARPKLTEALGARISGHRDWYNHFGRFIGYADKAMVLQHLHVVPPGGKASAVIPYYDLPGRVVNFRLFGLYRQRLIHKDVFMSPADNGGLFMLEAVPDDAELVIAVSDPVLALYVQKSMMMYTDRSYPVIAYQPDTVNPWPLFTPQSVFWNDEPTVDLFKQARRVAGSRVSIPQNKEQLGGILHEGKVLAWLEQVETASKPWPVAFKDALLDMTPATAFSFATSSELTPAEAREILHHCTATEKSQLASLLNLDEIDRLEIVNGKQVSQRADGWWEVDSKHRAVQATNFTFKPLESVYYNNLGGYIKGELKMGSSVRKFMAPTDDLSKNADKWIREFAMREGLGMPHTASQWRRHLMDLATTFNDRHAPHSVQDAHVGWSDDGTHFKLPGVTLFEGRIAPGTGDLPPDDRLPGRLSTTEWTLKQWKTALSPECINFWTLFGCVTTRLTERLFKAPTACSTMIINGETALSSFARQMDFRSIRIFRLNGEHERALADNVHDVPLCITTPPKSGPVREWIKELQHTNTFVAVDRNYAAVQFGSGWRFARLSTKYRYPAHDWLGRALIYFVQALQSGQADPDVLRARPVAGPLQFFASWIEETLGEDAGVLRDAANRITHGALYATCDTRTQCILGLCDMIDAGVLHAGIGGKRNDVTVGTNIVTAERTNQHISALPWPADCKTVIAIPRKEWDAAYNYWHSLRD